MCSNWLQKTLEKRANEGHWGAHNCTRIAPGRPKMCPGWPKMSPISRLGGVLGSMMHVQGVNSHKDGLLKTSKTFLTSAQGGGVRGKAPRKHIFWNNPMVVLRCTMLFKKNTRMFLRSMDDGSTLLRGAKMLC